MLERFFRLAENKTAIRTEVIAGVTTFLTMATCLSLGFISCPIIKLFSGRGHEAGWLTYALAALPVFYFIFVRSKMG